MRNVVRASPLHVGTGASNSKTQPGKRISKKVILDPLWLKGFFSFAFDILGTNFGTHILFYLNTLSGPHSGALWKTSYVSQIEKILKTPQKLSHCIFA